MDGRPIVCVDVDGVINLLGDPSGTPPEGVTFTMLGGIPHAIVDGVGTRLQRLAGSGELVWATGWGRRANELLPDFLGLDPLREVEFPEYGSVHDASWKTAGIEVFAEGRPLAWLDDSLTPQCDAWATRRCDAGSPTLLVPVDPRFGLQDDHVAEIEAWSQRVSSVQPDV